MTDISKIRAPLKHLRATDVAAVAKLAASATVGVTRIAEGVHQSVWGTLGIAGGASTGQTGGLTGLIYQTVRGVTHFVGKGIDLALTQLQPLFEAADQAAPETPQREAVLAALNGVLGDQLEASQSSLATPMNLRWAGRALNFQLPKPFELQADHAGSIQPVTGKILLLIHGLCMNDLQWSTSTQGKDVSEPPVAHNHGLYLAQELGYTPIYLRYNSGLHTSQNGHLLAHQLEDLIKHWPVPVEELSVVVHSMGGLVIRSAVHSASHSKADSPRRPTFTWPQHLKNIVFLGTPHHGAPLERAGNWLDVILGSTPYSRPFAKLGQLRSAGITDLRFDHVADEDWAGHDRFRRKPDSRIAMPLPSKLACFTLAATLAGQRSPLADRLIGDGLVPLASALGQHAEPEKCLAFAKASQRIVYRTSHMALLSSPEVARQLLGWLRQ